MRDYLILDAHHFDDLVDQAADFAAYFGYENSKQNEKIEAVCHILYMYFEEYGFTRGSIIRGIKEVAQMEAIEDFEDIMAIFAQYLTYPEPPHRRGG